MISFLRTIFTIITAFVVTTVLGLMTIIAGLLAAIALSVYYLMGERLVGLLAKLS